MHLVKKLQTYTSISFIYTHNFYLYTLIPLELDVYGRCPYFKMTEYLYDAINK